MIVFSSSYNIKGKSHCAIENFSNVLSDIFKVLTASRPFYAKFDLFIFDGICPSFCSRIT